MRRLSMSVLGLAALALSAVPAAAAQDAPADAIRPTGEDRYETAAKLAAEAYEGETPETVLIASGESFPDGLAASYLTGVLDAPILLVQADLPIPASTLDAIDALGATKAIIAGGTDTISSAVEEKFEEDMGADNVRRISGQGRVETATELAREGGGDVGTMADQDPDAPVATDLRTAIVAHAGRFPDALAVGALAFHGKYPLLLTDTDELSELTRLALEDGDLNIEQVIIAGGPNSVSEDVEAEIAALDNIQTVHRVAGEGRTETAADVALLARSTQGWDGTVDTLTTGETFPDALALAPLAARNDASILLTPNKTSVGGATFATLQSNCAQATTLIVASGPVWVPQAVVDQAVMATECADYEILMSAEDTGGESDARGTAWFWADDQCYAYRLADVTPDLTAAHIHEIQEEGATDGPPVADLAVGTFVIDCVEDDDLTDSSSAETAAELFEQIEADPASFYVNVHSQTYPDGEVRGAFG